MIALRHILVATDFGPAADDALDYGRALARRFGATLHVLHTTDNPFLRATIADPLEIKAAAAKRLWSRLTDEDRDLLRAHAVVELSDDPADAIVSYARTTGVDLIVMGTHGREGLSKLVMGSVAEYVVRTAPCPVLTIRRAQNELDESDVEAVAEEARL